MPLRTRKPRQSPASARRSARGDPPQIPSASRRAGTLRYRADGMHAHRAASRQAPCRRSPAKATTLAPEQMAGFFRDFDANFPGRAPPPGSGASRCTSTPHRRPWACSPPLPGNAECTLRSFTAATCVHSAPPLRRAPLHSAVASGQRVLDRLDEIYTVASRHAAQEGDE